MRSQAHDQYAAEHLECRARDRQRRPRCDQGIRRGGFRRLGDIQADLQALREDIARLAKQIADIFAAKGDAGMESRALERGDAARRGKGREAVDAVREVGDNMLDAIDRVAQGRPYTTLALAVGIGFLFGATWRR